MKKALTQNRKRNPKKFDIQKRTQIMGILNVTPDSFYDGGRFLKMEDAIWRVYQMVDEGVDIIDIGGQSTRPGSEPIAVEEELGRVMPVIEEVANNIAVPVSIDTYSATVAEEAVKKGASIVNDITGLRADPRMAEVVAKYDAACVIMHIKGTPKNMQNNPTYENLIGEIIEYLKVSIQSAENAGISPDNIIIDPGIGFGKTVEHNLTIINRLDEFKVLDKPILIGASRKSFISKILDADSTGTLLGTLSACTVAIAKGANIIRVHDVKVMKEIAKVTDSILRESSL